MEGGTVFKAVSKTAILSYEMLELCPSIALRCLMSNPAWSMI